MSCFLGSVPSSCYLPLLFPARSCSAYLPASCSFALILFCPSPLPSPISVPALPFGLLSRFWPSSAFDLPRLLCISLSARLLTIACSVTMFCLLCTVPVCRFLYSNCPITIPFSQLWVCVFLGFNKRMRHTKVWFNMTQYPDGERSLTGHIASDGTVSVSQSQSGKRIVGTFSTTFLVSKWNTAGNGQSVSA